MNSYGDLIKNILKIINLSEQSISNFKDEELKENFVKINGFNIDVKYADEFQDLLNTERTFYKLKEDNNPNKNEDLIAICRERIKKDQNLTNDYLILIEMLENSFDKKATELAEYQGYYVLKENLNLFLSLCRKLDIGPCKMLASMNSNEIQETFRKNIDDKKDQYKRINYYLNKTRTNNVKSEEVKTKISEDKLISGEFEEIIYLGIIGDLTIEAVKAIGDFLESEKYNAMLDALALWQIFPENEIEKLRKNEKTFIKEVNDIDKLVALFAFKDGVTPEGLEYLKPIIGTRNYYYLIDQLYKYGTIKFDDYVNAIEKEASKSVTK